MRSAVRGLLFVGIGLLLSLSAGAQRTRPDRMPAVPMRLDSQQTWLRRPGIADSTRVKLLINCCMLHMDSRLDSAHWYSEQAVNLAQRSNFGWGRAYALLNLAATNYYTSDFPAAQRTFEAAVQAARAVGQADMLGHAYLGLGNVASVMHNATAAQAYFAQAQQSYASLRPRFVSGELLVLHNRANGYLDANEPALARPLVQQGLALLRRYPKQGSRAKLLLELGTVQQLQHQPDSAVATWKQAARLSHADHDAQAEGGAWRLLAEQALQQQRYPIALAQAQRAADIFRSFGDPGLLADVLYIEASALAALHRPEAYDTLRRYTSLRDTLLSQQRLEAVANAQARFTQTEQQARIRALEQQRRIAALEDQQRTVRSRVLLGGLAVSVLLLGLTGLFIYRRRQERRERALRNQLAADLHDDVGTLLSQIALQTDLLQEGLAPPGEQQQYWAEVAGNSRMAVRQLNDVVWNLDAHNDTVVNLLDRLRDYAHEVLVPTGRDVRFVTGEGLDTVPDLLPAVRRQLYLIYKEALNNIIKHTPTDATVTVSLRNADSMLALEIVNSGPVPARPGRSSGHGLRNMQLRATALGGTATTEALPEGGFAVQVRVPV